MSDRHPRSTALALTAVLVLAAIAGPLTILASGHDAGLEVTISETNSPVTAGERLEVTVNVSNAGEHTHTQEITLTVGGVLRDSKEVTVSGGNNKTVTLNWVTETGDEGDYEAAVTSPNDRDTTPVSVEDAGPWYTVDIAETNAPIAEGDTLRVNATVQNIDSRSGNQTMELTVDGEVKDATNVSLDGGETTHVTFSWTTQGGDAGNYSVAVESNQEAARFSVQVKEAANISVSTVETNSPVVEGDRLTVTAVVENTGGVAGTETVSVEFPGFRNATAVTVAAGATKRVTLSWATQPGDVGTYIASVTAGTTTVQTALAVLAPQNFTVRSLETTAPVEEGQEVEVTAVIENVGDLPGNQTVTLALDGEVRNTTTVQLGQDENTTVSFTWQTGSGDAGTYTVRVATANDSAERDVTLESPPPETTESNEPPTASIQYQVDGSQDTVETGTTIEFTADATDPDGSVASYEWRISGEVVGDGPELEYTFDDEGAYEVTLVVTDDDGATMTVSRTIEVGAPEATETETSTVATTQTTASGPGLGILTALIALGTLLIGLRVRSDG